MMEDKQKICDLLAVTLRATRDAYDVLRIEYDDEKETVSVRFLSGGIRVINVAMDSGTAMIRDIMSGLGC